MCRLHTALECILHARTSAGNAGRFYIPAWCNYSRSSRLFLNCPWRLHLVLELVWLKEESGDSALILLPRILFSVQGRKIIVATKRKISPSSAASLIQVRMMKVMENIAFLGSYMIHSESNAVHCICIVLCIEKDKMLVYLLSYVLLKPLKFWRIVSLCAQRTLQCWFCRQLSINLVLQSNCIVAKCYWLTSAQK